MLISEKHNFIFVHIQKTAGESITEVLKKNIHDIKPLLNKHGFALKGKEALGDAQWNKYYKFAIVRNPWDRLVSWYSMIVNGGIHNKLWEYVLKNSSDFKGFIRNCTHTIQDYDGEKNCFTNQLDYLTDEQGTMIVDFVGRFENLTGDFAIICKRLGLPPLELPHLRHKSHHKHYSQYYTPEMMRIVADRYKRDIEYFGYTFEKSGPVVKIATMRRSIWQLMKSKLKI